MYWSNVNLWEWLRAQCIVRWKGELMWSVRRLWLSVSQESTQNEVYHRYIRYVISSISLYHLVSSCSNLISFSPSFWPMTSGNKPWRLALAAAEFQPSSQQLLPHSKSCRGKWDRHRFGKVVRARGVWLRMTHPLVLSFAFNPSADPVHTFFAVHLPSKNIQILNQWLFSWMESGSNC